MKLLIITQKVDANDATLGFFLQWIEEFAVRCESVVVICLEKGAYAFPENVTVYSLGKEKRISKSEQLLNFYRLIIAKRREYDAVFVHMNPEYIILGGVLWRMLGKKITLWYTHGAVTAKLRSAVAFAHVIFTASKESFRLHSGKVKVIGHGVDSALFIPSTKEKKKIMLMVGRISPTKRQLEGVKVFEAALKEIPNAELHFAGMPITEKDRDYLRAIEKYITDHSLANAVKFLGAVPHAQMPNVYKEAKVLVNLSQTGSLDKDVLEAMACDVHPVSTNEAFKRTLPETNIAEDAADMAKKVVHFLKEGGVSNYRAIIIASHTIGNLIGVIVKELEKNNMEASEVKEAYNAIGGEDYERKRWFSDKLREAGYEMTKTAIARHVLSSVDFKDCIELGPGAGTWTELLMQKHPNASFDAVDISSHMLELSKKRFVHSKNIRFFERNFLDFVSDKKYDFFFSSRALEYIPDKSLAVRKIAELLKSGGKGFLITKTPRYGISRILRREVPILHRGQIHPEKLRELFEKGQFAEVKVYPVTMNFPILKSVFLNKLLFFMFARFPLNPVSRFFSESYCVTFVKK